MRQHTTDHRHKRIIGLFAIMLFGMLVFALTPEKACAEDNGKATTDWQQLQSLIDANDSGTIYLTKDYKATETDTCLIIEEGKNSRST